MGAIDLQGYPRIITDDFTDEFTSREYVVVGLCKNCKRADHGNWDRPWVYNIWSHLLHFAGEDEYTLCGWNATELQWLWQL